MELGLLGGTAVSHVKGNLVDLETALLQKIGARCVAALMQNPWLVLYQILLFLPWMQDIVQELIWQI